MGNRGLRRSILIYLCVLLLSGALHVLTFHKDLFECFAQWFCGALLLLWALSIRTRVTDRRLRRLFLLTSVSMILYLLLQMYRFDLTFGNYAFKRHIWYCYHIPMITTPLLLLFIALAVHRPRDLPLPWWAWAVAAAAAVLTLGMASNDWHHLAFRFPPGEIVNDLIHTYGPLFYVFYASFGGLLIWSFVLIVIKARQIRSGLSWLAPLIPLLLHVTELVLDGLHLDPAIGGVSIWNEGESFCFAIMGFLDICIQIGLIPANTGYRPLFSRLRLSAAILDESDMLMYQSGGARWPFPEQEELQIRHHVIPGGSVSWATDLRPVMNLNRQLELTARELEERNAFLLEEGRMKKEMTRIETRNRVYERISCVLQPQLNRLETLTEAEGAAFTDNLPEICVLTAYVKRRSNMELLSAEGDLSAEELTAALSETVEALHLCGVEATVGPCSYGRLPSDIVIYAYEFVHNLITESLDELQALYVQLSVGNVEPTDGAEKPALEIRLMMHTADLSRASINCFPTTAAIEPQIRVSIENGDILIVLSFPKGGRAK